MAIKYVAVCLCTLSVLCAVTDGRPNLPATKGGLQVTNFANRYETVYQFMHGQWLHQQMHIQLYSRFLNQQKQIMDTIATQGHLVELVYNVAELYRQQYNQLITDKYNQAIQNSKNLFVQPIISLYLTVNQPIIDSGNDLERIIGRDYNKCMEQAQRFSHQILSDLQQGHITHKDVANPIFFLAQAIKDIEGWLTQESDVKPQTSKLQPVAPSQRPVHYDGYKMQLPFHTQQPSMNEPATEDKIQKSDVRPQIQESQVKPLLEWLESQGEHEMMLPFLSQHLLMSEPDTATKLDGEHEMQLMQQLLMNEFDTAATELDGKHEEQNADDFSDMTIIYNPASRKYEYVRNNGHTEEIEEMNRMFGGFY